MLKAQIQFRLENNDLEMHKFTRLDFLGNDEITQQLEKVVDLITFKKYYIQKAKIKVVLDQREENNHEIDRLKLKIQNLRDNAPLWGINPKLHSEIRLAKKRIAKLEQENIDLGYKMVVYNKNIIENAEVLVDRYHKFLKSLKFYFAGRTENLYSHVLTEKFESKQTEEEILAAASDIYLVLKQQLKEEIENAERNVPTDERE